MFKFTLKVLVILHQSFTYLCQCIYVANYKRDVYNIDRARNMLLRKLHASMAIYIFFLMYNAEIRFASTSPFAKHVSR